MIGEDDQKTTITTFKGTFDRGSAEEVPQDHAVDCQDLSFTSSGYCTTRTGFTKCFQPAGAVIRRFSLLEATPPNYLQPVSFDPSSTDGSGMLFLDNSHNLYIGNDPTPIYSNSAMNDFSSLNVGNRTMISPFDRFQGARALKLQILNPLTGVVRNAAGLAPAQSASFLAAANTGTGNVAVGVHKIAVIYETDTGYWTQPGPKKNQSCTPTASATHFDVTVFSSTAHGMMTGESHTISGGTGQWGVVNDTWFITRIDDDHFSIALDSSALGSVTGTFRIDAGFTAATVTSDGTHGIAVSNIPTGPSYVKKRLILATRADEEEFFFVPEAVGSFPIINDNTATTTTINFDDTDLTDSADYLFDLLEVIPAGTSLAKYRNRVVIAGIGSERVILSNINDFETFNNVSGYVQVQQENDGNNPTAVFVLRDVLYINKFTGTFAFEDNGNAPSTWQPTNIDGIIGCYAHGLSVFTVSQESADTGDMVLLASKIGLILFDGVMRRPELSWKIENIWKRINFAAFYRVTVAHDPWNHLIYVSVPLDTATEPSHLLVADYSDGRDSNSIKWTIFKPQVAPTCIGMAFFGSNIAPTLYTLKLGSLDSSYLFFLDSTAKNDDGTKIASFYQTFYDTRGGGPAYWKMLNVNGKSTGPVSLTLYSDNAATTATPPSITLPGGQEVQRQFNFINEKLSIKLSSGTNLNDSMALNRLDIWGVMVWGVRPAVV